MNNFTVLGFWPGLIVYTAAIILLVTAISIDQKPNLFKENIENTETADSLTENIQEHFDTDEVSSSLILPQKYQNFESVFFQQSIQKAIFDVIIGINSPPPEQP